MVQAISCNAAKFGAPLRYRLLPSGEWLTGEVAQIKGAELIFFGDRVFEVNTQIAVVLPIRVHAMVSEAVLNLVCTTEVVRRILLNWPEVRPALAVHISSCLIAPDDSSDPALNLSRALSGATHESKC